VEDHDDTRQARKLAKKAFGLFRQAGSLSPAITPGSQRVPFCSRRFAAVACPVLQPFVLQPFVLQPLR